MAYFLHSFGPLHQFFGPLLGFLYGWTAVLLFRPSSMAIVSLTFAKYVVFPFSELREDGGECPWDYGELSEKLVAAICLGTSLSILASYSIHSQLSLLKREPSNRSALYDI